MALDELSVLEVEELDDESAMELLVLDELGLLEVAELEIELLKVIIELLVPDKLALLDVVGLDIVLVDEGAIMELVLDDVELIDPEELVEVEDDADIDVVLRTLLDEELVVCWMTFRTATSTPGELTR